MELNIFVELLDGSRKQIGGMTLFSWVCSADTPADSLKVQCLQQIGTEVARIEVQSGGRRLFRGLCDRQKTFVDGAGCHTELWGRSDAAVLMDNEAIPQEYSRVSLQELFEKHIKPYGFQNDLPQAAMLNYFRVGKGVSEWEVFSDGCIQALGQQPFVHLSRVSARLPGKQRHLVGVQDAVLRLSRVVRREKVISQVLLRDEWGRYSTRIENPQAQRLAIQRRRCLIPSAQWERPTADAQRRMNRSMDGRIRWELELGKLVDWQLGDRVRVQLPEGGCTGSLISKELQYEDGRERSLLILE